MKIRAIALLLAALQCLTARAQTPEAPSTPAAASPIPAIPAPPSALSSAPAASALTTLPRQGGLPVNILAAIYFIKVSSIKENDDTFTATVDVRLRWKDSRLKDDIPMGYREFAGDAAKARLAEIWTPNVELANMEGEPTYQTQTVRIFADGEVELLHRVSAKFSSAFQPEQFPFDRQHLTISLIVRGEPIERVALDFRQEDLDFSHTAPGLEVSGWDLGLVDIHRTPEPGFHGEYQSGLAVQLEAMRQFDTSLAPIFIPLFASLLIPLMAIYLNKMVEAEFEIDAFELCNIVIGGLFAVIALNFTINSAYPALGSSDNPVMRLFALNYLVLGVALVIIITLFHFNLVKRWCGKYVQEQLYRYLIWAGPLLVLATALAILLAAAA